MKEILLDSNDAEIIYEECEDFILCNFLDFAEVLHKNLYTIEMLKGNEIELTFRKF